MNQKTRSTGQDIRALSTIAPFLGHGFTFAMAVGLFFFLGWKADGWLGSTPLFSLLGGLVGAGGGSYHIVRQLTLASRDDDTRDDDDPRKPIGRADRPGGRSPDGPEGKP